MFWISTLQPLAEKTVKTNLGMRFDLARSELNFSGSRGHGVGHQEMKIAFEDDLRKGTRDMVC